MKRNICLILLSPIILTAMGCSKPQEKEVTPTPEVSITPEPVDVVVISGQSNAVGCTHSECIPDSISSEKYLEYFNGYPTIQIAFDSWTKDWPASGGVTFYSQNASRQNDFVKVTLGQGNGPYTFGPEIGIAEAMHEKYANKLFLIKYACGASNLKDDWTTRKSPMYGRFIEYVKLQMNNLVKKGYAPKIKAFCWMQGEGDSYPGYHQVYQDNLREFVSNVREDLKDLYESKLPFIDAGISNSPEWQFYREVNDAKKAFAEESEDNTFIDTIAAGLHVDKEPFTTVDMCHYDSESEVLLGHLFAEAFEKYLAK